MQLIGPLKAQTLRFSAPSTEGGSIFLPDVVDKLRDTFRFVELPKTLAEYNLDTGITFQYGAHGSTSFTMLKIYNNGMLVEGLAFTDVLDEILDKVESIMLSDFATRYIPSSPVARLYTSQMEVQVTTEELHALDVFVKTRQRLTEMVRGYGVDTPSYSTSGFSFGADASLSSTAAKPGRFQFERRASRPFHENIFFAEAPLQTSEHFALLNEMSAELTTA